MYLVADMACVLCLSCLRLLFWFKLLLGNQTSSCYVLGQIQDSHQLMCVWIFNLFNGGQFSLTTSHKGGFLGL